MASRAHLSGTIFTRVKGLIRSGVLQQKNKPLWFNVWEAFPPQDAPKALREAPDVQVREIIYVEDLIRAKYYSAMENLDEAQKSKYGRGLVNLKTNEKSKSQRFVDKYIEEYKEFDSVNFDELFRRFLDSELETEAAQLEELKTDPDLEKQVMHHLGYMDVLQNVLPEKRLNRTVVLMNISEFTLESHLFSYFSEVGLVLNVTKLRFSNVRIGITALVEFAEEDDADMALQLDNIVIDNRNLQLQKLKDWKAPRSNVEATRKELLYVHDVIQHQGLEILEANNFKFEYPSQEQIFGEKYEEKSQVRVEDDIDDVIDDDDSTLYDTKKDDTGVKDK